MGFKGRRGPRIGIVEDEDPILVFLLVDRSISRGTKKTLTFSISRALLLLSSFISRALNHRRVLILSGLAFLPAIVTTTSSCCHVICTLGGRKE